MQHVRSLPLVSRAAIPQQRALRVTPACFPTMPKRFMAVSVSKAAPAGKGPPPPLIPWSVHREFSTALGVWVRQPQR